MTTYIVKEQAFAGSVTISVGVYGIEAEDFSRAKEKLRAIVKSKGGEDGHESETEYYYRFSMSAGSMKDEPLEILSLRPPPPTTPRPSATGGDSIL